MNNKLLPSDLQLCLDRIPDRIKLIVKSGFYVGGGFIRSVLNKEEVADYDIFANNIDQIENEIERIKFLNAPYVGQTSNAWTVKIPGLKPIQFIKKWLFSDPESCINSFDFAICRAVIFWDPITDKFDSVVDERFYESLWNKKLIYCKPNREEVAAGSFLRLQKFLARGYKINHEELAKVLTRMLMGMSDCIFPFAKTEEEYESNVLEMFEDATANFRGSY
jgi:hypothetical protein